MDGNVNVDWITEAPHSEGGTMARADQEGNPAPLLFQGFLATLGLNNTPENKSGPVKGPRSLVRSSSPANQLFRSGLIFF